MKFGGKVKETRVEVQQELCHWQTQRVQEGLGPQEEPLWHEQEGCLGRKQCPQPGQAPVGNPLNV